MFYRPPTSNPVASIECLARASSHGREQSVEADEVRVGRRPARPSRLISASGRQRGRMIGWRFQGVPEVVIVRCRHCRGAASFARPFTRLRGAQAKAASVESALQGVWEGGDFVVEHYPDTLPRKNGKNSWFGFSPGALGVVSCPACAARYPHQLAWPRDAFYVVPTRAGTLWAWNREWLLYVRRWVASSERPDGYLARHLPTAFKLAKNRAHVLKSINQALRTSG